MHDISLTDVKFPRTVIHKKVLEHAGIARSHNSPKLMLGGILKT